MIITNKLTKISLTELIIYEYYEIYFKINDKC